MKCQSCNANLKIVDKLIVINDHKFCLKCLENIMTPEGHVGHYISHLKNLIFIQIGKVTTTYYLEEVIIGMKEIKKEIKKAM